MDQILDEFIFYLEDRKQASENTKDSYRRDLNQAVAYFKQKGITEVRDIRAEHLQEYVRALEEEQLEKSTISRKVASLHTFFHFLMRKKYIDEDISEDLRAPKAEKKQQSVLSAGQIALLISQPDITTPIGVRDRAMMELLCSTGIGVTELIRLYADDVNLQQNYIVTGEEKRVVYFGEAPRKILQHYIGGVRAEFLSEGVCPYLFMNCSGEPMSRQGFAKILKGYVKKAGITEKVTPQILRHSFRVQMFMREMEQKYVQQIDRD